MRRQTGHHSETHRRWGVLGPEHPCGDDAALLVTEIFGNSVRHSGSGAPGETVTVAVRAGDGIVRVEVIDRGGPGMPDLRCGGRMVTWFELQHG
jgi:anti-sigma regulatory factor (Ser/Thr protein kinase)